MTDKIRDGILNPEARKAALDDFDKMLRFIELSNADFRTVTNDFLPKRAIETIRAALTAQRPVNTELLEALKSIAKGEWVKNEQLSIEAGQDMFTTDARTIARQAIARAEQKQKPKCRRCNNTGTWGGVDGHLYDCQDCAEQKAEV